MSVFNDLIRRLRGEYRIPITDGLGAAGGDEPKNPNEFVRTFEPPSIQKEAAAIIEQQAARIAELEILHKGADFAAKHNWAGWQQEIGRAETLSAKVADLTLGLSSAEYEADKWATQCRLTYERAEAAEAVIAAYEKANKAIIAEAADVDKDGVFAYLSGKDTSDTARMKATIAHLSGQLGREIELCQEAERDLEELQKYCFAAAHDYTGLVELFRSAELEWKDSVAHGAFLKTIKEFAETAKFMAMAAELKADPKMYQDALVSAKRDKEQAERELAAAKKEAGFLRAALRVNTMWSGATNEEVDALLEKAKEHGEQKDGGNG